MDYFSRVLPVVQQWTVSRQVVQAPAAHLDHLRPDNCEHFGTLEREQAACGKSQIDGAAVLRLLCAWIGAPLQYSYTVAVARQQNGEQTTHRPAADDKYIARRAPANRAHLTHTRDSRSECIHGSLKAPANCSAAYQASVNVL